MMAPNLEKSDSTNDMAKKKGSRRSDGAASGSETVGKHVEFKTEKNPVPSQKGKVGGLRPSPSANTLNRMDRETVVLWKRPFTTIYYAIMELMHLAVEFLQGLAQRKLLLFLLSVISAVSYYFYITPGPHQEMVQVMEKKVLWWAWWVFLGVLSSIGFGSGLHTFLIYLGPHIAAVTLAAYECNSLDFPEPPYPESIVCPNGNGAAAAMITLWDIVAKVRVESLLWGAGTALGELPPYFMARAARLSGEEPDDEEYKEFLELMNADKKKDELSFMDNCKSWVEGTVARVGFPGILLFASIPNPFFDLAGITCGHFLVPFWTFFGATLIGKAIVKMHVQMLFVILAFSEHHVDHLLQLVGKIPNIGDKVREPFKEFLAKQRAALHRKPGTHVDQVREPFKEFLAKQRAALHRKPGTHVDQESTILQIILSGIVTVMILIFCLSLFNSLAQSYHKRQWNKKKVQ